MTRTLLCVAATLAFAVSLPAYENRAAAQQSTDAGAEAATDSSQSADASANNSGSAEAQSSGTQTDSQSAADTDAAAQQSTTAENGTAQSSSSATTDTPSSQTSDQSSQSDSPSLPPPAEADAQADASVDATATQDQRQPQPSRDQPSDRTAAPQPDASARDRADVQADASVQGRAGVDAQARRGQQQDLRRGIRFGRATNRGLTVNFIERNSIFFDSGLRQGDIIVSLHGRPIRSEADFMRFVVLYPGQRVPVVVLRNGRQETVYITYPQEVVANRPLDYQAGAQAYLGVGFDPQVRNAAIVHTVTPGSPAEQAGLQPGDMLVALNGEEVRTHQDAIAIIRSMQPGDRLSIAFARRIEDETEAVLAGRPGQPVRTATREPDVLIQQRNVPPADDQPVDVDRRQLEGERRILNRDRNADRDANQPDERPLLQRLLD